MDGRKRKDGAERERIKKTKALATNAAKCCKISDMLTSEGPGEEGSSSSTRASGAPAELEMVVSSDSEQEPSASQHPPTQPHSAPNRGSLMRQQHLDVSLSRCVEPGGQGLLPGSPSPAPRREDPAQLATRWRHASLCAWQISQLGCRPTTSSSTRQNCSSSRERPAHSKTSP